MDIPQINASILFDSTHKDNPASLDQLRQAVEEIGFLTVTHTGVSREDVQSAFDAYRQFFDQPTAEKARYDMAKTGSNRGWGAPGAEQVDPASNPDYKEVFDCGPELAPHDPLSSHTYYAPNHWPEEPAQFKHVIQRYYQQATEVSLALLNACARSIGQPDTYFADKFDKPMALLRGNFYPSRPAEATAKDFGIAPHTDYGCLTLLATDGSPGLEVQTRDQGWIPVSAEPGTFIINFGEMLQMWSGGKVVATPHRVVGGSAERMSIPFFFNPRFDVNVAPWGSDEVMLAGDHLSRRYDETYVHRQNDAQRA